MPTPHSGFLIQGSGGEMGNFELVTPSPFGGLAHCWRDNDHPALPWIGPTFFGSGDVAAASLIQSNFGDPGHLEVVARVGDQLYAYWRDHLPPFVWYGPFPLVGGVSGNPALIQGSFGGVGNFELVAPLVGGGLVHYSRDNDTAGLPWSGAAAFGASIGQVDAVALIQSNFGDPGHLEVVARVGPNLVLFWRESTPPFSWHGPLPIPVLGLPAGAAPTGTPALIQGNFGGAGNFEVVFPLTSGGLAHIGRHNDDPLLGWSLPTVFGGGLVSSVALIQSNFGTPGLGSLEVAARVGDQVVHYWREDTPPFAWHGPTGTVYQELVGDPAAEGEWRIPYSSAVVGIHASLLHTGKVLFFAYEEAGHGHDHGEHHQHTGACVMDPATGEGPQPTPDKNLFCGGQTFLPDGRLLVAGGSINGVQSLQAFTPADDGGAWQDLGLMTGDRWYPTCTSLPDGRVLITAGSMEGGGPTISAYTCAPEKPVNATYEIYDPASGVVGPFPAAMFQGENLYNLYPFVFVLPSGKALIHFHNRSFILDPATNQFDDVMLTTVSPHGRTYPAQGSAVLLPLLPTSDPPYAARAMLFGGAGVSCPILASAATPATATCEILDLSAPDPAWQSAPPMFHPRVMPDAVLLPDGTVLVTNGSSTGVADNGLNPVFATDLYDPTLDAWSPMRSMKVPRLYHSVALLLPDGRVLVGGKDKDNNPAPFKWSEYRVEIFSPPYLFRGPRPTILAAPATVDHDALFTVATPNAAAIASAALIRPGAVTHSFNHSQRFVGLTITTRTGNSVTLKAPPDANIAPPGHYMLFLLDGLGVPSVAAFIQVL
jgi:hypothetical protein